MTYRETNEPAPDAEPAALMELSARMRALRIRVLFPLIMLGIAAAVCGAVAHVSGQWAITGRFHDGSYLVHRSTVVVAALLPAGVVFGIGRLIYPALRNRVRRAWRADAARRLHLKDEELDAIEQTF